MRTIGKYSVWILGIFIFLTGCKSELPEETGHSKIAEVRQQIPADMDKLVEGNYKNLTATKFEPIFPESNEWYSIIVNAPELYSDKEGEALADEIEEDYGTLKEVFGERLDEKKLEVAMRDENDDENRYAYNETFLEEVRKGKYNQSKYEFIMFESEEDGTKLYMFLRWNRKDVQIIDGEVEKKYPEPDTEETILTDIYFPNTNADNEKHYKLCDGTEITMQGAIDIAREWMENLPVESGKEAPVEKRVMVEERGEDSYMFTINFVGQHNGILFDDFTGLESSETGTFAEYDVKSVELMGKNEVSDYVNYGNGEEVQDTGEPITECLTLDEAFTIVSENIGVAAEYTVNSIEISYRVKEDGYGYPVWELETVNNVDKKETRFYVNAVSGEIEVDLGSNQLL